MRPDDAAANSSANRPVPSGDSSSTLSRRSPGTGRARIASAIGARFPDSLYVGMTTVTFINIRRLYRIDVDPTIRPGADGHVAAGEAAGIDTFGGRAYHRGMTGPGERAFFGPWLSLIHISEPTRRTPISYAVFCLKKK